MPVSRNENQETKQITQATSEFFVIKVSSVNKKYNNCKRDEEKWMWHKKILKFHPYDHLVSTTVQKSNFFNWKYSANWNK